MARSDHQQLNDEIGEFVQERAARFLAPDNTDDDTDEEAASPETGVLTGFVLVCEWVGNDGDSWITYHRPTKQQVWRSRGLLSEAIHDLP